MDEISQSPSGDSIEWAKAVIALALTEEVVRELMEVVRSDTERASMAAWALGFGDTQTIFEAKQFVCS